MCAALCFPRLWLYCAWGHFSLRARLPCKVRCNKFAGAPARRGAHRFTLPRLEQRGEVAPLVWLSVAVTTKSLYVSAASQPSACAHTHTCTHTCTRTGECATNPWLRARCSLLPTARVAEWRSRRQEEHRSAWRKWRKWRLRSEGIAAQHCWT